MSTVLPIYQVDAFTDEVFGGNPAAVVVLERWLDDSVLQHIAAENNLSETAFVLRRDGGWDLRWFTPASEVALCGHATLGAAHAIRRFIDPGLHRLRFTTRQSGVLEVDAKDGSYEMRFPAIESQETVEIDRVAAAVGAQPRRCLKGHYAAEEWDLVAIFEAQAEIEALAPSEPEITALGGRGLICTAPGRGVDFVSRCFYPGVGILEDPVTGSAHCVMTPYWAKELGREELAAQQLSARGGHLRCRLEGEHVFLSGRAVTYLEGTIRL